MGPTKYIQYLMNRAWYIGTKLKHSIKELGVTRLAKMKLPVNGPSLSMYGFSSLVHQCHIVKRLNGGTIACNCSIMECYAVHVVACNLWYTTLYGSMHYNEMRRALLTLRLHAHGFAIHFSFYHLNMSRADKYIQHHHHQGNGLPIGGPGCP